MATKHPDSVVYEVWLEEVDACAFIEVLNEAAKEGRIRNPFQLHHIFGPSPDCGEA